MMTIPVKWEGCSSDYRAIFFDVEADFVKKYGMARHLGPVEAFHALNGYRFTDEPGMFVAVVVANGEGFRGVAVAASSVAAALGKLKGLAVVSATMVSCRFSLEKWGRS